MSDVNFDKDQVLTPDYVMSKVFDYVTQSGDAELIVAVEIRGNDTPKQQKSTLQSFVLTKMDIIKHRAAMNNVQPTLIAVLEEFASIMHDLSELIGIIEQFPAVDDDVPLILDVGGYRVIVRVSDISAIFISDSRQFELQLKGFHDLVCGILDVLYTHSGKDPIVEVL